MLHARCNFAVAENLSMKVIEFPILDIAPEYRQDLKLREAPRN